MNMVMEDYVLSESQMKKVLEMGFGPTEIHEHSSMMFVHFPNPHPSYSKSSPILTRLVPASGEYYGIGGGYCNYYCESRDVCSQG